MIFFARKKNVNDTILKVKNRINVNFKLMANKKNTKEITIINSIINEK